VKVLSPAGSTTRYFKSGIPSKTPTSVGPNESPAIAIYNLQPGVPVQLEIDHPTCKMTTFPHTENGVTFTGNIVAVGGDTNTLAASFIE
jgi:hypothetical protein